MTREPSSHRGPGPSSFPSHPPAPPTPDAPDPPSRHSSAPPPRHAPARPEDLSGHAAGPEVGDLTAPRKFVPESRWYPIASAVLIAALLLLPIVVHNTYIL